MINALESSSTRPYLIRALYEWCTDNGFTPYIAVFVDEHVQVPKEYVKNNEIVLNVGFEATSALKLGNELIEFKEREAPVWRVVTPQQVADAFGDLIDDVDRASLTGAFSEWMADTFHEALRIGYWGWFDDDMAFTRPWGFDLAEIRVPVFVWQGAHDRMVPFAHGQWLASHIPGARPRLFTEHGHLSLAVDSFPRIVDELLAEVR